MPTLTTWRRAGERECSLRRLVLRERRVEEAGNANNERVVVQRRIDQAARMLSS